MGRLVKPWMIVAFVALGASVCADDPIPPPPSPVGGDAPIETALKADAPVVVHTPVDLLSTPLGAALVADPRSVFFTPHFVGPSANVGGTPVYQPPVPGLGFSTIDRTHLQDWRYFLPPPSDPSYLLETPFTESSRLGSAYYVQPLFWWMRLEDAPATFLRFGAAGNARAKYDTGYIQGGDTFDPRMIALDGTSDGKNRGQFEFAQFSGTLLSDLSLTAKESGAPAEVQAFVQADYAASMFDDGPDAIGVRHLYLRAAQTNLEANGLTLEAGSLDTLLADYGAVPRNLEGVVPIGSVTRQTLTQVLTDKMPQRQQIRLRYQFPSGLELGAAIEEPANADFFTTMTDAKLNQAPELLLRARYTGVNSFDSFQIAGILRQFAVEDPTSNEYTATGWGLAATTRWRNEAETDFVYAGLSGGEGIGTSVFGIDAAAYRTTGEIHLIPAIGSFVGYTRVWARFEEESHLWSNFAYGFTAANLASTAMLMDKNRKIHHCWANLIWQVNGNTAIALEYGYGFRQVTDRTYGDNHRIQMYVQIGSNTGGGSQQSTSTYSSLGMVPGPPLAPSPPPTAYRRRL